MKKEQCKRILGIAQSAMLTLSGICLMIQCVSIYRSGNRPFSRETVAAHFSPIAPVIYITLAMIAFGFMLELVIPTEAKKPALGKQYALILQRLQEKRNLSLGDEGLLHSIAAQQNRRRNLKTIRTALIALCSAIFLCYGCNSANFDQMDINASMVKAMYVLLPCCAVPALWAVYTAYQETASLQAEIELMKQIPLRTDSGFTPAAADVRKLPIRTVIVVAGIALMLFGYFTGGTNDVLTKAINICTECVGLG